MSDLVSIIVPVYNVKAYIADTIESVKAQTYTDWELLLLEDGSTDGTRAYLEAYLKEQTDERIKYHPLPKNMGAAAARHY